MPCRRVPTRSRSLPAKTAVPSRMRTSKTAKRVGTGSHDHRETLPTMLRVFWQKLRMAATAVAPLCCSLLISAVAMSRRAMRSPLLRAIVFLTVVALPAAGKVEPVEIAQRLGQIPATHPRLYLSADGESALRRQILADPVTANVFAS